MMEETLKENVTRKSTWLRGLFMLLFAVLYSVAEIVLIACVVIQFLFVLFSGRKNDNLLNLGRDLSTYIYEVLQYLTFNREEKPFPFGPWPSHEEKVDPSNQYPPEAV